jgi:hypothetical protein
MLLGMLLYFIFEVRICCCSHVIHDKLFVNLVNFCLNYCFHLKTKADCVRKVLCVCVCICVFVFSDNGRSPCIY